MAIVTPQSSGSSNILDLQQLQVWAQHTDVTLRELTSVVNRLTNLLSQIIRLNNLTQPS